MVCMALDVAAVNTLVYGRPMTDRLTKADWISHGLSALAKDGANALKVGSMADGLKVSRGSFYWHFRDRRDLLQALLASWEEETDWLIGESSRHAVPADRLLSFFATVAETRVYPPDTAIFAWARRDRAVARRAAATEEKRIAFVETQLRDSGIGPREARRRAEIGYLATLGWLERSTRATQSTDFGALSKFLFTFLLENDDLHRIDAPVHHPRGDAARTRRERGR
jgi:AcrR family transcriptional regulator